MCVGGGGGGGSGRGVGGGDVVEGLDIHIHRVDKSIIAVTKYLLSFGSRFAPESLPSAAVVAPVQLSCGERDTHTPPQPHREVNWREVSYCSSFSFITVISPCSKTHTHTHTHTSH